MSPFGIRIVRDRGRDVQDPDRQHPDRRDRRGPAGRAGRCPARRGPARAGAVRRGAVRRAGSRRSGRGGQAGFFDPVSLQVCAQQVRVGPVWAATLCVTGYPSQVGAGWLAPLTGHPAMVDVSVHLRPLHPEVAARRLRRQLARLESGRRAGAARGQLDDADVDAAAQDAHGLLDQLARGETRLLETTLTITVHAGSRAELVEEVAAIRSVASSLMITARPTTWRALHAWTTGLPVGLDRIDTGRLLDTGTIAASFPFTSADLPSTRARADRGVLYGLNLGSSGLVWWDRWGQPNAHQVVLGASGTGKSYFAKTELLRQLYTGTQIQVIDPENEFVRLADAVGGTVIRAGAPGVCLNPLDLPVHHDPVTGARTAAPDALTRQRLTVQAFLSVALTGTDGPDSPTAGSGAGAGLSALERAVLDAAISTAYRRTGITDNPRTWSRPAPHLTDLHDALLHTRTATGPSGDADHGSTDQPDPPDRPGGPEATAEVAAVAGDLAARLQPYVDGAYSSLFNGPSTTQAGGHLVVWSLRDLPDALKPLGMLLVLGSVWRTLTQPQRRPRLLVIDEAWTLLAHPAAAAFLLRSAKGLRKYWAGMTLITQDVQDMLASDLGRAVITNSASAVLLGQAQQALPEVSAAFGLSAGESAFLGSAERGEALLIAGAQRVALRAVASPTEDALITTDPEQLARAGAHEPQWIDLDQPPTPPDQTYDPDGYGYGYGYGSDDYGSDDGDTADADGYGQGDGRQEVPRW